MSTRKSVTSLSPGDRVRLVTRGSIVALIGPSDSQRERRAAMPAVVVRVVRDGYWRVVVTDVGSTTETPPQTMAEVEG